MRSFYSILVSGILLGAATPGYSQGTGTSEHYIGVTGGGGIADNLFGGTNTLGSFSNTDSQRSQTGFVAVQYGLQNAFDFAGAPVTAEIEFSRGAPYTVVSASFPGLPTPGFFYTSNITISRVGTNIWREVGQMGTINVEVGGGLGFQITQFSTSDGVVAAAPAAYTTVYAKVGLRANKAINDRTNFTFVTEFIQSAPLTAPLDGGGSGVITHATRDVRVGVGVQIKIGQN